VKKVNYREKCRATKALEKPKVETVKVVKGEFHDQADADWIVIRRLLWGHNDMPCGRPTPGRLVGVFSYY
jgi:hypothetical protein